MLKQRVLSALILAPLALAAILWLKPGGFILMVAAIFVLGSWEWARLAGYHKPRARLTCTGLMLALMAVVGAALWQGRHLDWAMEATALLWLLLPFWFFRPKKGSGLGRRRRLLKLLLGCWILLGSLVAIHWLRMLGGEDNGPQASAWIFLLLLLVWAADVGAYFTGKNLGRHKLAPAISPGKTWEGLAGGLALALLVGWAARQFFGLGAHTSPWLWLLLVAAVSLISVVGDLFISLLKRQAGLKDSSHLIPGHGGILDRFDSLLAASPWLALGVQWLK